jgi:tetratricopeptide (TPR) repeat protein
MKQVNLDNSLGKYQQAIDLIKSQKNSDSIANQTFLASVYVNKKEYQNALDIFAVINQQGQTTQSLAENAASVAQQAKDYQLAINYYQQAKKLAANNKSNPVASSDITYYDGQIQTLEKQLQ